MEPQSADWQLSVQFTPAFVLSPVTVALNCCVAPGIKNEGRVDTDTATFETVTWAEAVRVASAVEAAATVTTVPAGSDAFSEKTVAPPLAV
jgi:hypothetical protein